MIVVFFLGFMPIQVHGEKNCPVRNSMLYAYVDGGKYRFRYDFDPFIKTNIDLLDRLLTSDKEVICDWVVRTKEDHTAVVHIEEFQLKASEGNRHGDCVRIYDGKTSEDKLLGELCGGDISPTEVRRYNGTSRYMFVVYLQGEVTGQRSFSIYYIAEPQTKELILKIAGIVSGSVAAAAIVFLIFKFSHGCRPCRRRCCPDETEEEGMTQRELRPLAPVVAAPAVASGNREGGDVPGSGSRAVAAREANLPGVEEEEEDDGELSIPPDEPPPSYDSIFGLADDRNKAD